ncbi:MAG: complex I NDUFA9 subunit family protein [Sulfuriferula sp.]|nr:complex I NDUFA9 subunit family protein [Sulfuriferula sp.]
MKFNRICVLGGSGFVGSAIVQMLAAQGREVRVLTRNRDRAKALTVLPTVDVVEVDIHDQVELNRQFAGMDAVINLVGVLHEIRVSRVDKPSARRGDFHENHVELPRKVLHACATNGIQRVLHMSALGADPTSRSAYQRSKGVGEALMRESGMPSSENERWYLDGPKFVHGYGMYTTIFRPSVIFGRGDSFLSMFAGLIKWLPVIPLANAGARFQPVWVDDVARAFVNALDESVTFGMTYDVCGPKVYTLQELVEFVAGTIGKHPRIIPLCAKLSYLQAWALELTPGKKLMTRDNYFAMQVDNVCSGQYPAPVDMQPAALEAVAAEYLGGATPRGRYTAFRHHAGR